MESRLKERLTGAAILVALIVLIVPEIFHDRRGAPTPPGPSTGAPTGANTVPTRSYTIELAPRPAAAAQAGVGAQPPVGPQSAVEPKPVVGAARTTASAPVVPEKPAAAPPAPRSVATVPTHKAAPEASAKTRVASASGSSHGRGGGWTVQLGLFAKSANAERLARTAQSHGFDVAVSRFGPRGLYRVAVAGIADRAAAEQISHRLRGAGLPAAILGPR